MADDDVTGKKGTGDKGPDATPWSNFDFNRFFEQLSQPGANLSEVAESMRRDFEAVQKANQITWEGWQALAEKQAEIFRETAARWQQNLPELLANTPQENLEKQSEVAREALETALGNLRNLAELAAKSQTEAMSVLQQRFEENLKNLFGPGQSAGDKDKGAS
jgi:phasin family protein